MATENRSPVSEDWDAAQPLDEEEAFAQSRGIEQRVELPEGRDLRGHTARGVLINSFFEIGLTGIGFVRRVGIAAFLTQTEYGFWGLIVTTLVTLSWLKQVGISDKYVQQDDPDEELAFQKAFTLELLYSVITYALIVAALPLYALIYGQEGIILPGAIAALALIVAAFQTPIWIAYRRMQFVRQRALESIDPVVGLIVTFGMAAAGYGYWSLVIGGLAGAVASALGAVATSRYRLAFRYDRGTLREYFSFSWPLFVSALTSLAVVQGAVIVGNISVGLAGVGVIGLAGTIAVYADRVDQIVRQTIYPAVCAIRERRDVFFEAFVKSNRIGVLFGLTFGVGLALFAPDVVRYILGERWRDATGILQAFGLIIGFRQIAYNWTVFIRADGETRPLAVSSAIQVAVFFIATAPLILLFGTGGYAAGMAIGVAVDIAVRLYYLGRLFPGFRVVPYLFRSLLPAVPAVLAVGALRLIEGGPRTVGMVVIELIVYCAVTAVATFKFERPLVSEVLGYLRRGGRVREAT